MDGLIRADSRCDTCGHEPEAHKMVSMRAYIVRTVPASTQSGVQISVGLPSNWVFLLGMSFVPELTEEGILLRPVPADDRVADDLPAWAQGSEAT